MQKFHCVSKYFIKIFSSLLGFGNYNFATSFPVDNVSWKRTMSQQSEITIGLHH